MNARLSRQPRSLSEAAMAVMAASLPGRAIVSRSAVDAMLSVDLADLNIQSPGARRMIGAAMLRSRVYSAIDNETDELADFEAHWLPKTESDQLSEAQRSLCHAAVAEAYVSNGRVRQATQQARLAVSYADEADHDGCRFRALSLLACSLALNGEFGRSAEASAQCRELEARGRWSLNTASLPLVLAEMMVAYARLDATSLATTVDSLGDPWLGPVWCATRGLATGWLSMLEQDFDGALLAATGVSGGADAALVPRLITGLSTGLQAMALVHRGEATRALTILDGVESLGDHALCFNVQRTTALLQLGENREVLMLTDDCLRLGVTHNLRTLSSILLRRAVANNRLGHTDAADNAFSEGFRILADAGAMTPMLGISQEELDVLAGRLVSRRPDAAGVVDKVLADARSRPRNEVREPLPTLTRREVVVARRLRTPESLVDIAASLYVSANTLKSQVRSLYVKLGVSSREEAVARLEREGFYERRHPDDQLP